MRVAIDPGYGGSDPGAIGRHGGLVLQEKDFNLSVGLLLEQELRKLGHATVMTRRIDRTLSLGARARFANQYCADIFVSVHANSAASAEAEGFEVFHFEGSKSGSIIASTIETDWLGASLFPGFRSRGVKTANFAVLRLTRMPAVLVECGFISNPAEARRLALPVNQAVMAKAVAGGIARAWWSLHPEQARNSNEEV